MYLDMVAARDPMHRLQQYSGSLLVNDDGNTIRIRKRGKERDIKAAYRYVYGINLDNPFVVGTIVERKAIGSESPVSDGQGESLGTVTAQAETSKQKSSRVKHSAEQKHAIYQAIESNVPEDEIMNQYNLTKGQLGAFKAHVTMRNGTSHANGNGFYPDDREAMIGLLSDGHSPQEVYDLVSDKYSLPQIRGLKASLTRTKMEGLAETPLRVQILERDGYQCGICHVTEEEHRQRYNHGLHVHHIDYNPRNNDQRNQIALCVSHHAMTNTVQHAEVLKPQLEARIEEIYANVVST